MYASAQISKYVEVKLVKAYRDIFRRLFCVTTSGGKVNMEKILKHELSPLPLSLAKIVGSLNIQKDTKASLSHILADKHTGITIPTSAEPTCDIIDGMALIKSIGKPRDAKPFGDLAGIFSNRCCIVHVTVLM